MTKCLTLILHNFNFITMQLHQLLIVSCKGSMGRSLPTGKLPPERPIQCKAISTNQSQNNQELSQEWSNTSSTRFLNAIKPSNSASKYPQSSSTCKNYEIFSIAAKQTLKSVLTKPVESSSKVLLNVIFPHHNKFMTCSPSLEVPV